MRAYLIGAATLALAASTAFADPGKGQGGGAHGGDHSAAAPAAEKGGGQGKGQAKQEKSSPQREAQAAPAGKAKGDHGPAAHAGGQQADRASSRKSGPVVAQRNDKANDRPAKAQKVKVDTREARDGRFQKGSDRRDKDPRLVRTVVQFDRAGDRGLIDGCPPGLAKKHNGCQPPGLAKDRDGYRDSYYRPSWFGYGSAQDGRYFYDDGYLYRMNDGGSVLGYIPLLGGALSIGNPWPSSYQPIPVPDYYVDYYNLGQPGGYRYADDVLYRVDPQSNAITSIAALLTGDQFGVGQRMPAGYDVYNVPYGYQDQYYDTPQSDYRYADGYVYQVDPTTQLIQAAIQLLT